jgi:hypothetical protein
LDWALEIIETYGRYAPDRVRETLRKVLADA